MTNPGQLVLTRHGVTEFNQQPKRFTGFTDVGLPPEGKEQAKQVGQDLKKRSFVFNSAYTSWLKRSWITLDIILEELEQTDIPIIKHPFLNERHYGDLQERYHRDVITEVGQKQYDLWHRSYAIRPPNGESLQDVVHRTDYYLENEIMPRLKAGESILICGHGNSNRAIVKQLENISDHDIVNREIAWDVALIYTFDDEGRVIGIDSTR